MVCPCSSAFGAEASFFLGLSERMVERYISKFLVTGDVNSEIIGRSYEETRKGFQLKKARVSFVFGVENTQTNVHSWCIHFHARWTQLIKFCISNSVTTAPFGRATSVRHSPFSRTTVVEIPVFNNQQIRKSVHALQCYFSQTNCNMLNLTFV